MDSTLGCVLAVRDRPAEYLERTFQTYAYQTLQPADRVLVDYGSALPAAATYRELCRRHGWRYVPCRPRGPGWSSSAAYNAGVAALRPEVDVVFKSDLEVLLGQGVLEMAAVLGRARLCVFSCLTTVEGATYPAAFTCHGNLAALLDTPPVPVGMAGDGVHAYPRRWFEHVGGYDLAYEGWGYEDSDLRLRAGWSIGVLEVTTALLVHQWHPPVRRSEDAARNRLYYERTKPGRQVIRNGGALMVSQGDATVGHGRPEAIPAQAPACAGPAGLLDLVPLSARRVLDLGCGIGELGRALKARQPAAVWGVAICEEDSHRARQVLDDVSILDPDRLGEALPDGPFDSVVCRDLLARVRDPGFLLRLARDRLRPGGQLVAGFANMRHHAVITSLLGGTWEWEPAGLFDRGHVRFFTRREVEKLFYRAGLAIRELRVVPGPGHAEWAARGRPPEARAGGLTVTGLSVAEAEEFYAAGYLVSAMPAPAQDHGLTSVVILTHNQLEYTRLCVDSIRQHTDEPYELVFVDNGSTDGTPDYLRSLPGAKVIANPENRGFPAGCNQGIQAASGRQVLLLNNDTIVTTGWLGRLLRALHSDPRIGLVGPCSNCVSGSQQVDASYEDLPGLDSFAWERGKLHDGQVEDTNRLIGFCLLIRREVVERVGLLDERFGVGCFEDDDYTRRAQQAGYRAVIARDAFVHHFGSRTFLGSGIDLGAVLDANREVFRRKWQGGGEEHRGAAAVVLPGPPAQAVRPGALRVLVVAHVGWLRDRMDKSHYYRYEALVRWPGVTLFGPGLEGYRPGMSVREAVEIACGGVLPDVILHGGDLEESGVPLLAGLEEAGVLTAIELLDAWARPDRQVDFIRRQRFALGLIQEAGPHLAFYQRHCPGTKFFWTPNAVDTRLFRDHGLAKEYDVILYGETSPEVYPLRARLARLLAGQRDIRFRHIPHPGYYPPPDAPADAVLTGAELSREINRSWVGIATRSIYHCLLMKYLEIAASHALVAGDMPEHGRPLFGEDFIELGMEQSDEEILATLRSHLADRERLQAMTKAAHRRVLREHSTEAFVDRVLGIFGQVLARRQPAGASVLTADGVPLRPGAEEGVAERPRLMVRPAPGGGLLLAREEVLLSLCMIVRDNAHTLTACLESIRPWVDEMVVVDTGSQDETPRMAEELGARVFHFPWCDDFSAARNESLKYARGRWVFWMDSDDTIDPECGRRLRELALGQTDPRVLGYVVQVHCPGPGEDGHADLTVVDHVKLFRNLPELRFEGRIHEQVLPALRRLGGEVAWTDLFVTHSGYDHSPEGQRRKRERDLRLLHLEHQERGEHPFTLFNLGMTYADIGQHQQAVDYLRRSIGQSGPNESHLRKAYALLAHSYGRLGRQQEAWDSCQEGLRLFPGDLELNFRRAILLHEQGRLEESARAYLDLLGAERERHFTSVDRGIAGFKARHNLAVVYGDLGDLARAEEQWRLVVQEQPRYRSGWRGLGETLFRQGRLEDARAVAEQLLADDRLRPEGLLLLARLAEARGDREDARRQLQQATGEFPDDVEAWQALCRFLFEQDDLVGAEEALKALVRRSPEDAAARHNLGTVHLRAGRAAEAVAAYRESLRLRPEAPGTHLQLGNALRASGRLPEAITAWEQALHWDPNNREAAEALRQARRAEEGTPEEGRPRGLITEPT